MRLCLAPLIAALLMAPLAHAQSLGDASLVTLRGLRVGAACDALQPSLESLRAEGFQLRPIELRCSTGGDFRSEVFIRWNGTVTEELHLYFTPENALWRVKTMTQWNRGPGAAKRPTDAQLVASLERRFGKPSAASAPSSEGEASAWQYQATWESIPAPNPLVGLHAKLTAPHPLTAPALPDVLTTASFNHSDAKGPAPQLLVDMYDRGVAPRAEGAYVAMQAKQAAEAVERSSRMLPNL